MDRLPSGRRQLLRNKEQQKNWRSRLDEILSYYQSRISDEGARRAASNRFDNARDFAVRVTSVLHPHMDVEGLWQLAINFACLTSGFPPSGEVSVDVAMLFCNKFEMALEILRRKSYEFMDEIESEENYDEIQGHWIGDEIKGWLLRQRLPPDSVIDLMQEIGAAQDTEGNVEEALNKALFKHIHSPIRHPDHITWWIQCLEWFHKALMSEGQIVQSEGQTPGFSFKDSSHLVLHAVKHGARMSLKTIGQYYRDAVKWKERSEGVNHPSLPMPKVILGRNGYKTLKTLDNPRRKLAMREIVNHILIKTYHVMTSGDSGNWPYGPYDILKAERLQSFVDGP